VGKKKAPAQPTGGNESSDLSLQAALDGIEDRLFIIDGAYRVRFANLSMRQTFHGNQPIIGQRCYEVFEGRDNPCSSPLWTCPLPKVLQNGDAATIVSLDQTPNAEPMSNRYVKITLYPLRDGQGHMNAFVELRRDVTAERELEDHIVRRYHHLHALNSISSATSGLSDLDFFSMSKLNCCVTGCIVVCQLST